MVVVRHGDATFFDCDRNLFRPAPELGDMSLRLSLIPDTETKTRRRGRPGEGSDGVSVDGEWGRLMAAAQDGNGGAYRRLLAEVTVWLRRYFVRRLPPADVDDAIQETLLAIHRSRHTYDPAYPFPVWLRAIAKRKWVDQLRVLEHHAADALTDEHPTPDHGDRVIGASVLAGLLGELRPAQALVIRLVKLEGYSLEEASIRCGQSISAVKVNIHRGIARLRTLILENGDVA